MAVFYRDTTKMTILQIVYRKVNELKKHKNNTRTHSQVQIYQIINSINEFGWTNPILIDEHDIIIAGHGRLEAAEILELDVVPCIVLSGLTESQKRAYRIADNQLPLNAGWDIELLQSEIEALKLDDFDIDLLGFDSDFLNQFNINNIDELFGTKENKGNMADEFLIPPFTVFNAREKWWQNRKKQWIDMGIQSELGRDNDLAFSKTSQPPEVYSAKNEYENKIGKKVTWDEFYEANPNVNIQTGTSIFDPVVCEIAYRWFSPVGGTVLDPFSGGSVRGVVAALLERQYVGCDLRPEQVESNQLQWSQLNKQVTHNPIWLCGDSQLIEQHAKGVEADFIFSCPPYVDLEVYSDDPNDLSTMNYPDFINAYRNIIRNTVSILKDNRFACFVVGEVRDKKGNYYNFVGDTIKAFIDAGMKYYNEAILVTQVGSLPIRAGKPFKTSRKLGKTHQNILIFVKGDSKLATEACGDIEITMPDATD